MFGNVFFRDFPYKLVTHARVFSLSFVDTNINPKAALFISVNMQFLNKIFSYSNMASWQKIKKLGLAVFVPFKNEKIDFEYMEKFINILEEERLQILNQKINAYSKESNEKCVGKTLPVLILGTSEKDANKVYGYTDTMKLVNVEATKDTIGKIIPVTITAAKSFSLDGKLAEEVKI